jgi:hypothetical protein
MPVLDLPDLHLPEATVYLFAAMVAPRRAPSDHQRLVEATRNIGIIRALERADVSRIRRESLPDIVRAATGPKLEDVSRTFAPGLFSSPLRNRVFSRTGLA